MTGIGQFFCVKFRRFLSLINCSVILQLHQLSCLRVTLHSLYLDNFGLCQKCEIIESFIDQRNASLMDRKTITAT